MNMLILATFTYVMPASFPTRAAAAQALEAHCSSADAAWVERDTQNHDDPGQARYDVVCQWDQE